MGQLLASLYGTAFWNSIAQGQGFNPIGDRRGTRGGGPLSLLRPNLGIFSPQTGMRGIGTLGSGFASGGPSGALLSSLGPILAAMNQTRRR